MVCIGCFVLLLYQVIFSLCKTNGLVGALWDFSVVNFLVCLKKKSEHYRFWGFGTRGCCRCGKLGGCNPVLVCLLFPIPTPGHGVNCYVL